MSDHHEPSLNDRIRELLAQITALQEELRDTLTAQEARVRYTIEGKRIEFERTVQEAHARLKQGLWRWLRMSRPRNVMAAPFIYGMIVPLVLFDVSITLYQHVCFRLFGIARVQRSAYMVIDHHKLSYLNIAQKFNCLYCEYGTGLMAYAREIVARTEQYWCPIKHAHKVLDPHAHYSHFMEYGDADNFQQHWQVLRDELAPDSQTRACQPGACKSGCQ